MRINSFFLWQVKLFHVIESRQCYEVDDKGSIKSWSQSFEKVAHSFSLESKDDGLSNG